MYEFSVQWESWASAHFIIETFLHSSILLLSLHCSSLLSSFFLKWFGFCLTIFIAFLNIIFWKKNCNCPSFLSLFWLFTLNDILSPDATFSSNLFLWLLIWAEWYSLLSISSHSHICLPFYSLISTLFTLFSPYRFHFIFFSEPVSWSNWMSCPTTWTHEILFLQLNSQWGCCRRSTSDAAFNHLPF